MGFDVINRIKKEKGLTNAQISAMSGVTLSTLDKITSGVNKNPKLDTLQAICRVLGCTLNDFGDNLPETKNATPYSGEALKLAADYDKMDKHGKQAVKAIAEVENSRIAQEKAKSDQKQASMEAAEEITYFIVPYFFHPSSAGTGTLAGDEDPEDLQLTKRPPRGTSFVTAVSGDSMEPTFHNGDKVFVRSQLEIEPGQVGIFLMDEDQYIKELGDGFLISHNPAYGPRRIEPDTRCQGLVLGVCDESYFA